jgi:hypothetical protein
MPYFLASFSFGLEVVENLFDVPALLAGNSRTRGDAQGDALASGLDII